MRRTIVIGDIHGCYDELIELLNKIRVAGDDHVISVGDLIAKGPKNREVLDLFSGDSRFSAVIGNHDLQILNFWRGRNVELKQAQRKASSELEDGKARYKEYLTSLPFFIDLGSYAVVHAGVRPGIPLIEQTAEDLVELRTLGDDRTSRDGTPWFEIYNNHPTILFGHWPFPEPRKMKHAIGLDTGCVYGHELSAYIPETEEFVQVKANQVYEQPGAGFKRALATRLTLK